MRLLSRRRALRTAQLQDEEEVGLILQFEGPSGIPYITHNELDAARQRLIAEGVAIPASYLTAPRSTRIRIGPVSRR